jgi:Tol biopolymer transport system component
MPSARALVLTLVAVAVGVAVGIGVLALNRSDPERARGDLIAYSCKEPKNPWYAVCVVGADGSDARRLTSSLATTDPAWSPDGRRVAFTRNEDVGESTLFTSDDVFVMDSDGSDVRPVVSNRDGRSFGQPAWSPDGSHIAFVDGESVSSAVPSRLGRLTVVDVEGSGAHPITDGSTDADPDWSPDGREIAFTRGVDLASFDNANQDIHVVDVETEKVRRLTRTPPGVFESAPAWAPDGTRIAFARWTLRTQFDGKAAIYVMNRDGTDQRLVLEHRHFASGPYSLAWSPDGRKVAFETSSELGCTSISTVSAAGGAARPLTACTRPRESSAAPAWQPAVDPG